MRSDDRYAVREQVVTLLLQKNYDLLIALCRKERSAWKALQRNLYSTDENVVWPTVESLAMVMKEWWNDGEDERVREYIRGLFWSLNDESGGIGWNAPQTIAEIVVQIPELIEPYGSMIIDRTMEESLLVQNGLWAIGRMGRRIEPAVEFFRSAIMKSFESHNSQTLGLVSWAMGEVKFAPALSELEPLRGREETIRIYSNGDFREKSLGQWVTGAITEIRQSR